ncbi:hypothetical protein P9A54_gp83 [Xanthomonas phage vB_Xar_IVIA-DoCa10]|uniref:Uncharacterized protein n=1 Tax=Xanthomonas phage vB_Xar_IVIA-DoCa10 TaxID=2975529 RepID=A0A9X9NYQ5_9CAUD|nr:hypothetical protein P9A54_gp83 [Xanthomonas phage vB_Xar_IVIA-DoCa10]UYA99068.1 hypothetical protein IVIADoCa10_83 [Xanthomonas phage vB_Xar_IVIA-DoCa10]
MSELPTPEQMNALLAADLIEVRAAWGKRREAESQLSRLAKYRTMTPGMKDDQKRWLKQLVSANAVIDRILGA